MRLSSFSSRYARCRATARTGEGGLGPAALQRGAGACAPFSRTGASTGTHRGDVSRVQRRLALELLEKPHEAALLSRQDHALRHHGHGHPSRRCKKSGVTRRCAATAQALPLFELRVEFQPLVGCGGPFAFTLPHRMGMIGDVAWFGRLGFRRGGRKVKGWRRENGHRPASEHGP